MLTRPSEAVAAMTCEDKCVNECPIDNNMFCQSFGCPEQVSGACWLQLDDCENPNDVLVTCRVS